jgi:hypothetical protein
MLPGERSAAELKKEHDEAEALERDDETHQRIAFLPWRSAKFVFAS